MRARKGAIELTSLKLDKRTWMSTEEVNAAIWQCMLNWVEAYVPQNMFQTEDQIKKVHEQCQKRFEVYSGRVKKKANAPYSTPQPASKPKSDPKSATAPKAQVSPKPVIVLPTGIDCLISTVLDTMSTRSSGRRQYQRCTDVYDSTRNVLLAAARSPRVRILKPSWSNAS